MAAWDQPIKFEDSPAESFVSTPGDSFPSLFEAQPQTLDPSDMMTPPHGSEDATPGPECESPAASDGKKQTKKRKSWGQVLPEPKTNLPPRYVHGPHADQSPTLAHTRSRKRAKTEDEKEQRRVERVLRNRRAAQSSRERKRLEVEALEIKNKELEALLNHARQTNLLLAEELKKFRRDSGARSSSPFDSFHSSNPVTLSQELFGSHDVLRASTDSSKPSLVDELINSTQSNVTVNPASLSPVPETEETEALEGSVATPAPAVVSSDLTQRPAAMLCDLQCQSEEMPRSWLATQSPLSQTWTLALHLQMLMITSVVISACQRPLMQIAMSLRAGFSLPPTQPIMRTIIWLVTRPSSRSTRSTCPSTSTTSSTMPPSQTRSRRATQRIRSSATASLTLRLKSLQKILTCSPNLARPLMDATMEALRLASEGSETQVGGSEARSAVTRDAHRDTQTWLAGNPLPSKEVLLTLLWALRVEERKLIQEGKLPSTPTESSTHSPSSTITYILTTKAPLMKRKADTMAEDGGEKRLRSC